MMPHRDLLCFVRFAITLALFSATSNGLAVPVSWVADDGLWQTAANWSSNPTLPGSADDVTIDRPGTITVTLSAGNPMIRSISSQENLVIGGGTALTLAIGAGGGQIHGALTVSPGARLMAGGGVLQANGTVTADSANLRAENSGQLNLPTLATLSAANSTNISAHGVSSSVNLPGVTSLSGPGGFVATRLVAEAGGRVNLSSLTSISGGAVEAMPAARAARSTSAA